MYARQREERPRLESGAGVARGNAIGGAVVCCCWCAMWGARRERVSADVRVEWPEKRGSIVCREMWERRSWGLGAGAVVDSLVFKQRAKRDTLSEFERGTSEAPIADPIADRKMIAL